ncbi:MAG: hypothetical protein ONB27_13780 [candidate division KSB1 bacterium]|nr:hypothetical protein [candidate division KSB1 bacterium]
MDFRPVALGLSVIGMLTCASRHYTIRIGESFFHSIPQRATSGRSAIERARADSVIEAIGIYNAKLDVVGKHPLLCFYSQENGKLFIPLSTPLAYAHGSLIQIQGRVLDSSITYPFVNKTQHYRCLKVRSSRLQQDNQKILAAVNRHYQQLKLELQTRSRIEGSKLQFADNPDWDIWWDGQRNVLIFSSHQADLMYAADIDFVVDASSGKLTEIFASQWFKGE